MFLGVVFTYIYVSSSCTCLSTSFTGTFPDVSITGTTSTNISITVNISMIERIIIGHQRLDLGVPVVGEYENKVPTRTMSSLVPGAAKTFSSLVPGVKYRITAWGLGGGDDRNRSQSPAVMEVTTMEKGK